MLFSKQKSGFLANEFTAKYNGTTEGCKVVFGAFTTCHYKVKFRYKNMRAEAYPFLPFSHIWIQNFVLRQDVNFSIGNTHPSLGLDLSLNNFFSNKDIPIFSNNAYDIAATKSFCREIKNEMDIDALQLGKEEYLGISDGQIVLQSKYKKFNELAERIEILANIFKRNVKI